MSQIVGIAIYFIRIGPLGPEICPFLTRKSSKNDVNDVGGGTSFWRESLQPITTEVNGRELRRGNQVFLPSNTEFLFFF